MSYSDAELVASAREDVFSALIKMVAVKGIKAQDLRDEVKPHMEQILSAIDSDKEKEDGTTERS